MIMKLNGAVFRYTLENALKKEPEELSENGIARALGISPNAVNYSLKKLVEMGAVAVYKRHIELVNFDKALYYWASVRNLKKDVVYSTYVRKSVQDIEKAMPSEIAFTAYTAYVARFGNDASDYSEVYLYATEIGLNEIKKRFPKEKLSERSNYANLIVLEPDRVLYDMIEKGIERSSVPTTQIYVDLWNLKEWYAAEFLKRLETRIKGERNAKRILQRQ
jgi:DNA-binding Lrp family transcriptional regulator